MSANTIHQTLHGYRRGHEQLAGSIRLPPYAADLVTRLSDLSGSVGSGWDFGSYITAYPVDGVPYFALARTWEDRTAPRAGCVLTHTLFVPIETWKNSPDPQVFSALFADSDELRSEERFRKPINTDVTRIFAPRMAPVPGNFSIDFVRKYFGEGQRPMVWTDCSQPEETAWAIVRVLWPALRAQFAWCTASLQPRSLDTRMLDLQFVPHTGYSRFHNIPRENFVTGGPERSSPPEPWCIPCAEWIFFGMDPGPIHEELLAFGPSLREDPTLMRSLFLARELCSRVDESPMAGAGLLDVAATLAPSPVEAVEYKETAARRAVAAAIKAPPDEALKCLFLAGERLTNPALGAVSSALGRDLSARVESLSSHFVRESLVLPERVVSRVDVTAMPYFQGVTRGLARCAKDSPEQLICLQEFNKTSPHLIAAEPKIAGGYLRGLHMAPEGRSGRDALAGWISGLKSSHLRHSLRGEVLPEVRGDFEAGLVEELCRDMPPEDVAPALTAIVNATDGLPPGKILETLQEAVAGHYPDVVRDWAVQRKKWSSGVVSLVASTFTGDARGFRRIVSFDYPDPPRRAVLLTAFLDTCTAPKVPGWLKDVTKQSADWLAILLASGDETPPPTIILLVRLLPELREVPIAARPDLRMGMWSFTRFPFWPQLVDLSLRSALTLFIEGMLGEAECREWFWGPWAANWLGEVSRSDLAALLIHAVNDRERRERAFRWLAFAPDTLYQRDTALVSGLCWELVSDRRHGWTSAMGNAWAEIIRRLMMWSSPSASLKMCADVLKFGFNHTSDSVGAAVAAAFQPVYRAVCDSSWTPPEVSDLFGWFDWDKAKELRKGLIRAFVDSSWSPGDLALAAREDPQLLRKLVKRALRSSGEPYLTAMLNDLVGRGTSEVARTTDLVRDLASDPDFYEPWD